jgi:hypothetical protein
MKQNLLLCKFSERSRAKTVPRVFNFGPIRILPKVRFYSEGMVGPRAGLDFQGKRESNLHWRESHMSPLASFPSLPTPAELSKFPKSGTWNAILNTPKWNKQKNAYNNASFEWQVNEGSPLFW